jgi:hypothetical protein
MTECEVVRTLGQPQNVEIQPNERGERTAVMTYTRGVRPGTYRFSAGRLTAIERGPAPPEEPKAQKKPAPKGKKPTNA